MSHVNRVEANDFTEDTIWSEAVRIRQPRKGYRFTIDSVLLAHFINIGPEEEALEIGSGSGVVSILVAALQPGVRITAMEVQPRLAKFCRQNVQSNCAQNIEVVEADVVNFCRKAPGPLYDLIFSNAPYRKSGAGRLNPNREKAIARHELAMKMEDLFVCSSNLLKPDGRLTVIFPDYRFEDFDRLRKEYDMHYTKFRRVLSYHNDPPAFFLASVSRMSAAMLELADLVLYDAPGVYTKEAASLLKQTTETPRTQSQLRAEF